MTKRNFFCWFWKRKKKSLQHYIQIRTLLRILTNHWAKPTLYIVKTFCPLSSADLLPLYALCFTQPRGSLVVKSCLILCNPKNYSMPGFPVLHYLPKFAQTHVHCHPTISSCHCLLPLHSIFPSIRVFSNELTLRATWSRDWSSSFSSSPSKEYSGLFL